MNGICILNEEDFVSGFFGALRQNSRAGKSGLSVADVQIQSIPNIIFLHVLCVGLLLGK